ncbi:MAG: PilN domain-containing protein [Candidatus Shapirobacteria bacterium]
MPSRRREISLLPSSENVNSFFSRALNWTTTVGRVIIIFTEMIVITAFLSRFWLDRKNSDLSEVIRQQKAILSTTTDFQQEFKKLQNQLIAIDTLYSDRQDITPYLAQLTQSIPPEVSITNLSYAPDLKTKLPHLTVEFITVSDQALISLIENLSVNPQIESVNIGTIEKKTKDKWFRLNVSIYFKK